jgi:CheY-like chemotaxis protein
MPLLVGDEQRVFQVVSNLLQNATKFTRRGRIRVDAWLLEDDSSADAGDSVPDGSSTFLHVRVADTGRGIPFGLVGRVFEPFDQGDPSTNRDHGGTGLGLALSLELCEAMGGGIAVLSRAGVGSVFEMRVRLSVAPGALSSVHPSLSDEGERAGQRAPMPSPALPSLGPVVPDLSGVRVLVVDDNRLNRKLMSMWIEARGGVVTAAADGAEGVRLALEADFDCVLMDMSMPVMNGLDAASAIRAAAAGEHGQAPVLAGRVFGRAHVPIIGVTAMARRDDRLLCLAAGMDAHLAKPVRSLKLARTLRRVTDAQNWLAAAHRPEPQL